MKGLALQRAGGGPGRELLRGFETFLSRDAFKDCLSIALRRSSGNFVPQFSE
jgi:hypothetical protein